MGAFSLRDLTPEQAAALDRRLRRDTIWYDKLVERMHRWVPGIRDEDYAVMLKAIRVSQHLNDLVGMTTHAGKGRAWADDPAAWCGEGI